LNVPALSRSADRTNPGSLTFQKRTILGQHGGEQARRPAVMPRKLDLPSPEDDAAIQRGIEQDPDSPESGEEFFRDARPASMTLPPVVHADLAAPERGYPDAEPAKVQVTFPVDQGVFDGLQASGPGWQARANEALRRLVKR